MDLNEPRFSPRTLQELESLISNFKKIFGREPNHDEHKCLAFVRKLMHENQQPAMAPNPSPPTAQAQSADD